MIEGGRRCEEFRAGRRRGQRGHQFEEEIGVRHTHIISEPIKDYAARAFANWILEPVGARRGS
ncbi:hypothetical protein K0U83_09165 [bacterium]|nr:hypothetical protein [bacterium]